MGLAGRWCGGRSAAVNLAPDPGYGQGQGNIRRLIAGCKGGDRRGYSDAFQSLGHTAMTGQRQAVLLVAQRPSAEREAHTARTINRQFARCGVQVIAVPIDDRSPESPVAGISAVEDTMFARGSSRCLAFM